MQLAAGALEGDEEGTNGRHGKPQTVRVAQRQ
jgi:hypothetical protein